MAQIARRTPELCVPKIRDLFFRPDPNGGAIFIPSRYKIAYGGRGGGKSEGFAAVAVAIGAIRPIRMLCVRELQNSIRESVHKLLCGQIVRLGLERYYDVQKQGIYGSNGTEFIFSGIKNNPDAIKSMAAVDYCWPEEAQRISRESWEMLIPTIRGKKAMDGVPAKRTEFWISFNPVSEEDDTYMRFVAETHPNSRRVFINWDDNPWFPEDLEEERQYALKRITDSPDAIGRQQLQATYDHVWGGKCRKFPGGSFFSEISLLADGRPVDLPPYCDTVYVTVDSAMKSGKAHDGIAVAYWARAKYGTYPLILLDWDLKQIDGGLIVEWFPSVLQQLEGFAKSCKARLGSAGAHIEDKSSGTVLIQQGIARGWNVHAINSKMTSLGKHERAFSISTYVHTGDVKITKTAYERVVTYKGISKNHMLSQVLGFTATVDDMDEDDALDVFCYGVAIGLGTSKGF